MAVTGAEAIILDLLLGFVGEIATDPPMEVSYPNVGFTPEIGVPFLSVAVLPNTSDLESIAFDSEVAHEGLMRVSVFWPAKQGDVKPFQVASQIVAAFKPGTRLVRDGVAVLLERQPSIRPSLQESDWTQVPVMIRWRASSPANA